MTTAVTDTGTRTLDFTGNSIQLVTRKGADLLWVHRFRDSNGNPLDITNWSFTRDPNVPGSGTNLPIRSSGGVRNGTDPATGNALSVEIDIVKLETSFPAQETYDITDARYDTSNTTLIIDFAANERPASIPANMFFRFTAGDQGPFTFDSSMIAESSADEWTISAPGIPSGQGDFTDSGMYTLEQRDTVFEFADSIQCYFRTRDLTNVNPSSGRSNNAPFEIEADIPTGRTESDGMTAIDAITVVAAGQITVFSDVYNAPSN